MSKALSGKMKPSEDEGDVVELGVGEEVSKEGSEGVDKETSAEVSGGDEELLDVGLSQLKKRKLQ